MAEARSPEVAIIGAGMSGLCMAMRLKRAGIESFTIYEKADDLGGTWRDNTYPGLTCDVPSRLYQYSFSPNPGWTHLMSPGPEIQSYFRRAAESHGLLPHIRFGTEVTDAEFADDRWRITTAGGERSRVDFLVSATGVLHHPRYPDLPGIDTFRGAVFHSARWDHDTPLAGRRVAVVGTGSTGVQLVCGLAGTASPVTLFQRTAQWILPAPNPRYTRATRALHRRFPALDRLQYAAIKAGWEFAAEALTTPGLRRRAIELLCRANLRTVRDRRLRRALTPDFQPMCKRLIASGGFYRAMQRDDVELVTSGIARIAPDGVVTEDGALHPADVLVLATGFDSHAYVRPMRLTGLDGVTLEQAWAEGPRAYRTVALPGFPNFFMLMGPHSPVGNYPLTAIAETQARYVLQLIELWRRGRMASAAPTRAATDAFNERMRAAMPGTVWVSGCDSWYLGSDGLPETWPWNPAVHRRMLRAPALQDYAVEPVA